MAVANKIEPSFFQKLFGRSSQTKPNKLRDANPPAYQSLFPETTEDLSTQKSQVYTTEKKPLVPKEFIRIDGIEIELPIQLNESRAGWYKQKIEEAKEFTEKNKYHQTIREFLKEHAKDSPQTFEVKAKENGNLSIVREKKENQNHGIKFECYMSGKIKSVGNWINGVKEGFRTYYHTNGEIETVYQRKNNLREGMRVEYNEQKKLIKIDHYHKDLLEGTSLRLYSENEQVMTDITYSNNQKNGPEISYYKEGSIESITNWKNNDKEGGLYTFYPDKSIKSFTDYKNGFKEGSSYKFYKNKTIKEHCTYKEGFKEGPETFYREDKTKEQVINWFNNQKHEEAITYDPDGNELKQEMFWHGKRLNIK